MPKIEEQINRLYEFVNALDQLGEDSFHTDYYQPPSQRRRIVRELEYITWDDNPRLFDPAVKVLTKTWQESLDKIHEDERSGIIHAIKSTSSVIGGLFMDITKRLIIPNDIPKDARFVRKTFTENDVQKTRWVSIY